MEFLNLNIADQKLPKILKDFKANVLIHCAAQASVAQSINMPAFDAEVNIGGALNLFEAARPVVHYTASRIIYLVMSNIRLSPLALMG